MPLYDYLCASCKKTTEVLQGFNEKPLKICPHCGGKLKKLASAPAIQFKGSGWYVTDYAKKSSPSAEGSSAKASEKGSDKAGDKGSEKSVDSQSGSKDSRESKIESRKTEKPSRKDSSSKKD